MLRRYTITVYFVGYAPTHTIDAGLDAALSWYIAALILDKGNMRLSRFI
jgi:hypothetical protein